MYFILFCLSANDALAARVLLTLLVFGQMSFLYVLGLLQAESHERLNIYFVIAYVSASTMQVIWDFIELKFDIQEEKNLPGYPMK